MTDKLASLVRPLEDFAAKNPGVYKLRVALLAALGYAYLLLVVSLLLAIVAAVLYYGAINTITIKALWIPLVLIGIVVRSLWITLPEPDGTELKREQAPPLFDLIHEVKTTLNGPNVDHVLLSSDFNAGIVQIPQFGMFGWPKNYLVIGLPLLRAFSPEEFRAVLAHEVGHLSGKHSRFSGWIYRLRQSWIQVLTRVHYERHYASFLFEPFLNWYAPYLNAYSFVLARAQELHADEFAVDLAGKQTTAVMLARLNIKGRALNEDFWPAFFRNAKEQPKAPTDPFEQMLGGVEKPIGPVNAQKWFFEALRVPTGYEDTHPALSDRLAAIGYAKDSPEVAALLDDVVKADEQKQSAASYYLRDVPEDFLPRQNRLFREQIIKVWNDSHAKANEARKRFAKLEEEATQRPLTLDEQWERVALVAQIENESAAIAPLQTILSEHPEHAGAHFALGAILLEQQNTDGVKHLEQAMQLKPATVGEASSLLSGFYFQQGNKELAETFRRRAVEHFEQEQKQREKALSFSGSDRFLPHEVSAVILNEIKSQLDKARGLSEAYLFRKVIEGSDSVYVLAFLAGYTWHNGRSEKHLEPLFQDLMNITALPSPLVFLSLDMNHIELLPKIKAIPDAAIYKRG